MMGEGIGEQELSKYPETQTTPKNPDLVGKNKKTSLGPMLNQWQIDDSISQEIIDWIFGTPLYVKN